MTKQYDHLPYQELMALARRRNLPLRGGKLKLIERLRAADAAGAGGSERARERKPDRVVRSEKGQKFVICGLHNVWKVKCSCEDTEDERAEGGEESQEASTSRTGARSN